MSAKNFHRKTDYYTVLGIYLLHICFCLRSFAAKIAAIEKQKLLDYTMDKYFGNGELNSKL